MVCLTLPVLIVSGTLLIFYQHGILIFRQLFVPHLSDLSYRSYTIYIQFYYVLAVHKFIINCLNNTSYIHFITPKIDPKILEHINQLHTNYKIL